MTYPPPVPGRAGGSPDAQRVARDLADHVTCGLFGIGLELHGALARIQDPRASEGVRAALTGLDDTIDDLRRAVFDLRTARGGPDASDL